MLCSLDVFIADRTVKVWDLNTGEETLSCAGHKRDVVAVRYCRKSQRIFGASQNIIKVFIVIVFLKKKKDKMFCRFFPGNLGVGKVKQFLVVLAKQWFSRKDSRTTSFWEHCYFSGRNGP